MCRGYKLSCSADMIIIKGKVSKAIKDMLSLPCKDTQAGSKLVTLSTRSYIVISVWYATQAVKRSVFAWVHVCVNIAIPLLRPKLAPSEAAYLKTRFWCACEGTPLKNLHSCAALGSHVGSIPGSVPEFYFFGQHF